MVKLKVATRRVVWKKEPVKKSKLLTTLLWMTVLTTLADLTMTVLDLNTIGYHFEANPLIKSFWTAIGVKCVVILLVLALYQTYYKQSLDTRFVIIMAFLSLTIGQGFGAISHVPLIIEQHQAARIIISDNSYTIQDYSGSIKTYTSLQPQDRTSYYFKTVGLLMALPMTFSLLTFLITRKTSNDLQVVMKK